MIPNLRLVERKPLEPQRDNRTRNQVGEFTGRLMQLRDDATSRKVQVEDRWLVDLRQLHGRYNGDIEARIRANSESRLFVNLTRSRTNGWAARLGDMLFPADEANWGIRPTPVPTLSRTVRALDGQAMAAAQQANQALKAGNQQQADAIAQQGNAVGSQAAKHQAEIEEAKKRADAMQDAIADQLIECDYNSLNRSAIEDACKLGTGILKGPMSKHRVRQGWKNDGQGFYLADSEDPRPEFLYVNPWHFYPDMDGTTAASFEFTFERHMMNDREVRRFGQIKGVDQDEVRTLLEARPREPVPYQIVQMREITGNTIGINQDKFMLWEYHGLIKAEELELLAKYTADRVTLDEIDRDPSKNTSSWRGYATTAS
jgi:hypothetical protein